MGPTQPQMQGVPEGKQPRREADHSAPSSAEPKNEIVVIDSLTNP